MTRKNRSITQSMRRSWPPRLEHRSLTRKQAGMKHMHPCTWIKETRPDDMIPGDAPRHACSAWSSAIKGHQFHRHATTMSVQQAMLGVRTAAKYFELI